MTYICVHPDVRCPTRELHFFNQDFLYKQGEKYYRYYLAKFYICAVN